MGAIGRVGDDGYERYGIFSGAGGRKIGRFEFLEFPEEGEKDSSEKTLEETKEKYRDQHHYLQEAWKKYREGDFEQALLCYSKALRFDSSLIVAWEGQVRCLVDLGEFREAETWLTKALGLYPKNSRLLSVNALVYSLSGRFEEAITASDEAIAVKSEDFPFLWLDRGAVLLLKGNVDSARVNFLKVLEEYSNEFFWYLRVGLLYMKAGKGTLAVELLLKASELAPAVPFVWYKLGQAYLLINNQSGAKKALEKALEVNKDYALAEKELIKLNKKACFIATCLELDEERLSFLRERRDLMRQCPSGEIIWGIYSSLSPYIVNFFNRFSLLKDPSRWLLSRVVDVCIKRR